MAEQIVDSPVSTSPESVTDAPHQIEFSLEHAYPETQLGEQANTLIEGYKNWAERYPFAATTAETVALFATKVAVQKAGDKIGLNTGNALKGVNEQRAIRNPAAGLLHAVVVTPVVEETAFRYAPAKVAEKLEEKGFTKAKRVVDVIADIGFALGHAGVVIPDGIKPKVQTELSRDTHALPIAPYLGGRNYRRLYKSRGMRHSVYAHTLNNLLASIQSAPQVLKDR